MHKPAGAILSEHGVAIMVIGDALIAKWWFLSIQVCIRFMWPECCFSSYFFLNHNTINTNRTSMGGFGVTARKDIWWARPLFVFLGLSSFIVYATWAAFQGEHYAIGPYISP